MHRYRVALIGLLFAGQIMPAAEVSYQETTKITGGSMLSMMKFASAFGHNRANVTDPVLTTIAVKENQMARWTDDSGEIIDLDAKTVTHVDKAKRTYTVTTFEQLKQALEQGIENAKREQAKANSADQPQRSADPNVQLGFETHVRNTGAAKQVSGLDTNETILTLMVNAKDKTSGQQGAFGITNDMWMAADVPGYDVVREFEARYAQEIGRAFSNTPDFSSLLKQTQSSDALKQMGKEMSQLKGIPVLQVMRMGMSANGQPLPAASEAALPSSPSGPSVGDAVAGQLEQAATQTAAQEATQKIRNPLGNGLGSAIGGIGGFGGFGRKKKQQTSATETAAASNASSPASSEQSAVLIEAVTEVGHFSQQVDPALLQVPAGFQLVSLPVAK